MLPDLEESAIGSVRMLFCSRSDEYIERGEKKITQSIMYMLALR